MKAIIIRMKDMGVSITKQILEREAWRLILLTSQHNTLVIRGVKAKDTTNEPLAIVLLGTDTTPIISNKDPMCRLIIRKASVREIHITMHAVHSTDSTTMSRIMTGKFGVLMVNGEDEVQDFMSKCMTCKKSSLLHYISPVGMTDTRMMPTIQPFAMISVDPIPSWPIVSPEGN